MGLAQGRKAVIYRLFAKSLSWKCKPDAQENDQFFAAAELTRTRFLSYQETAVSEHYQDTVTH